MKKARAVVAIVIVLVVIGLLLARCSSSSSSPSDTQAATPASQPSAELSLIGVQCDTPGEVVEEDGASFVCTPSKKAGEAAAMYYGVATPVDEQCDSPGKTRSIEGIFSVCANDVEPKKRKWLVTVPLPVAVTAFIESGDSTEPGALEETGVTIPEAIAALPGMQEFAVASPTTQASPTTTEANPTTTQASPTTTEASPTTTQASPTTTEASPTTTQASPTTTEASPTTTQVAPTTTEASPTTTQEPATTVAPVTTLAPVTTTVTAGAPTCAQGGPCATGDAGPGGGTVLVLTAKDGTIESIFEVAPVTWYSTWWTATDHAAKLVFGSKDDWRLPTVEEGMLMARSRNLFTCPGKKRCARGFSGDRYWSLAEDVNGTIMLESLTDGTKLAHSLRKVWFDRFSVEPSPIGGAYVRPVRWIIEAPG
jgi:hypothetical protein